MELEAEGFELLISVGIEVELVDEGWELLGFGAGNSTKETCYEGECRITGDSRC